MLLIPAIDLKDGQCVRLLHGDMDKATVFGLDPMSVTADLHITFLRPARGGDLLARAERMVRAATLQFSEPVQIRLFSRVRLESELEQILENRNILVVTINYVEVSFLTHQIVKAGYLTTMTLDARCRTFVPRTLPPRGRQYPSRSATPT